MVISLYQTPQYGIGVEMAGGIETKIYGYVSLKSWDPNQNLSHMQLQHI